MKNVKCHVYGEEYIQIVIMVSRMLDIAVFQRLRDMI